jgi:stage II sporulation protein D
MAASAAVLYYLKTSLEKPSALPEEVGWARAALLEAIGKPRFCSAGSPFTHNSRSVWQSSGKPLVALLLFISQALCLSARPAEAGLLSFFHHKNKHRDESTAAPQETYSNSDSNPAPAPTEPAQVPKIRPSYFRPAPLSNNNRLEQSTPGVSSPLIRSAKRDWLPPQPVNCSCLGNQKHLIRVALALNVPTFELVCLDGAQIIDASSGEMIAALPPQSRWSAGSANQALVFRPKQSSRQALARWAQENSRQDQSELRTVAYYQPIAPNIDYDRGLDSHIVSLPLSGSVSQSGYFVKPLNSGNQEGVVGLNGRFFRGALFIQPTGNLFNAINYLPIEDYLLSVVPSEMPSSWPIEALKAQAIAARSYAYANLGKHGSEGYDLKDNTEDQAYSGIKSEYDSTNLAVSSTSNFVVKYDGKPICAYFHSTSGGSTELSENVWSKPLPYLKAVADYDDLSPHFSWSRKYSIDEVEGKLAPGLGPILTVFVVSRSKSQRVSNLLVVGKIDAKLLSGEMVRRQLKLPSTNFNVFSSPGCYIFCGRGFGHGLGLSQWGARALAEQGYNAAQILAYYYKDIVVEPIVDNSGS